MVLYSRCGMCGFPVVSTLDSRARIHALQPESTRLLLQFRTRTLTTRIQHESERAVHIHLETQHKFSVHWHSCRFLLPCQSPAQQSGLRDYCNGSCSCLFLALTGFNRVSLEKCHTSAHWFNRRQSADGEKGQKWDSDSSRLVIVAVDSMTGFPTAPPLPITDARPYLEAFSQPTRCRRGC